MAHDSRHERPARRGRVDDTGGDADGGKKLYYHLTAAGRGQRRLPQPHPAGQPGLHGGLLLQAPGRLGHAGRPRRGPDRHHRLPGRARAPVAAAGRHGGRRGQGRPPPGHLRQGQPVRGDPGPRHRRAAQDQPPAARDRQAHRRAAARHQRQPLRAPRRRGRARRPAVRADRVADERPQPLQVPRRRALPQDRGRDALAVRRGARGVRQHAVDRRAGQRRDRLRQAPAAELPPARGVHRATATTCATSPSRAKRALGRRPARRGRRAAGLRAAGHRGHGVQLVLPHRVGPDRPRPPVGHPGRPGPGRGGVRGGLLPAHHRPRPDPLRPAVRALPQPVAASRCPTSTWTSTPATGTR